MRLDVPTIALVASLVYATQMVAVFAQHRVNRSYEGLWHWFLGTGLQALGCLMMPLAMVPELGILPTAGGPLVALGQVLLAVGVRRFLGLKPGSSAYAAAYGSFAILYLHFVLVDNSISGRSVAFFAATSLVSLSTALALLRGKRAGFSGSAVYASLSFIGYSCAQAAMAILTLVLPPVGSYGRFYDEPVRVVSFLIPIAAGLLWTFGLVLMVNQRLNEENRSEKDKFRMIFGIGPAATLLTRLDDGLIIDVNDSFLAMTGFERGATIGNRIPAMGIWVNDGDRAAYISAARADGRVDGREYGFRRKDGTPYIGRISGRTVMMDGDACLITMVEDVTEARRAENEVKALLAEKELILKEVHHRIKNNMATVQSLLSLQASTLGDAEARNALKDAGSRVGSMATLYDRLYRTGRFDDLPVSDFLSPLVDEILSGFSGAASVRIRKDFGDFVLGPRTLQTLGIIVNELLTNILKYAFTGRKEGIVSISARLDGKRAIVVVADDGNGMPASVDFGNSTGFGLVLINALTLQLDGHIRIERGLGTTVVLEFPR